MGDISRCYSLVEISEVECKENQYLVNISNSIYVNASFSIYGKSIFWIHFQLRYILGGHLGETVQFCIKRNTFLKASIKADYGAPIIDLLCWLVHCFSLKITLVPIKSLWAPYILIKVFPKLKSLVYGNL